MKQALEQRELLIWCDAARVPLVADVLSRVPMLRAVSLGGPNRAALGDMAAQLGLSPTDDLRKSLIDRPVPFILLAGAEGVGHAEQKMMAQSRAKVLTFEPIIPTEATVPNDHDRFTLAPHLFSCPAWLSAAEPLQVLEPVRSVQMTVSCPRAVTSLFARLFEAMQALTQWLGVPQTIDAALTGGLSDPPENPQAMAGDLTAHVRFNGPASAVLHLSDRLPTWERRLRLCGDRANLQLNDTSYKLSDSSGKPVDALKGPTRPADPADLIARQFKRVMQGAATHPFTTDPRTVYSCCQATLLSCRTGQAESPATLMRIRT